MKPVICEKKTYTVAEIMEILGIGRTAAYDLTRKGLFKVIRVGKLLRINKESFDQWFDSQQFRSSLWRLVCSSSIIL